MGGLDWTALPIVVEMLGVQHVDILVAQLKAIASHQERNNG